MPIHEHTCNDCGDTWDYLHPIDDVPHRCAACDSSSGLTKHLSLPNIGKSGSNSDSPRFLKVGYFVGFDRVVRPIGVTREIVIDGVSSAQRTFTDLADNRELGTYDTIECVFLDD